MTTPPHQNIQDDPLARAVLRTLASRHSADEALGSFARTVLSGEATLRDAASQSWHGEALSRAGTDALDQQARLSPAERFDISEAARRLQRGPADSSLDRTPPSSDEPS